MVAKTTNIERLFLSGYGVIGKNNDLDVTGFEKYRLIQAADHGNVEEVNKMLRKKGKCFRGRDKRESKLQQHKAKCPSQHYHMWRCKMLKHLVHSLAPPYLIWSYHGIFYGEVTGF